MQLDGKTALVTGGSGGIGLEIARQLIEKGARVVILGRDQARLDEAARWLGSDCQTLYGDLALPSEQERIVSEVQDRFPALALLINNAGLQINLADSSIGDEGRMEAMRTEIAVNLTAPMALGLGLMPLLATRPEAAIVNVTSGLAIQPKRSAPSYCASKAGLRTFTQALRYRCEDATPTIRVIDAIMAYTDTAMTEGRDGRKLAPARAARDVVAGIERGQNEIWVGNTRLLQLINRLSPRLAARILRNG